MIYVLVFLLIICVIAMTIVAIKEEKEANEKFKKDFRKELDRISRD